MLLWTVLALYAAGRLAESFVRLDDPELALGLSAAQWTSVVLVLVAVFGALWTRRRYPPDGRRSQARMVRIGLSYAVRVATSRCLAFSTPVLARATYSSARSPTDGFAPTPRTRGRAQAVGGH